MPKCHIKSIFGKSSTSLPGYSKRWSLQRYPLRRCLPRQFTPISGAKSLKFSVGWLQRPTAGALSLEFLIVVENRTPWRVNYFESPACGLLIPIHPSDGDHELLEFLPWVRPLDNLSWATFFSFHCGRDCRKNQREDCAKWTGKITVTIAVTYWRLVCSTILIWKLGFFVFN